MKDIRNYAVGAMVIVTQRELQRCGPSVFHHVASRLKDAVAQAIADRMTFPVKRDADDENGNIVCRTEMYIFTPSELEDLINSIITDTIKHEPSMVYMMR